MTSEKYKFLLFFSILTLFILRSFKTDARSFELNKTAEVLDISYGEVKGKDSLYLAKTKELHAQFLKQKTSQISIDSTKSLIAQIQLAYKNIAKPNTTYAYALYKDLWSFCEDISDHDLAITLMEELIVICNVNREANHEYLMNTYSYLHNQLLYAGECEKAIETVFVPAFILINEELKNSDTKDKIENYHLSKINMQAGYLYCARQLGDGDLQRKLLKISEALVVENHDDIANYNIYKADLLGLMASTYMKLGDLSKAGIFLDLYEKYMEPVDVIDDILLSFRKLYFYSKSENETKFYKELQTFEKFYKIALKQFPKNTQEYALAIGNRLSALECEGILLEKLNPIDPKIPEVNHRIIDLTKGFNFNAHINPLEAYSGLISYYIHKKQKDSSAYYLRQYKDIAVELNSLNDIRNAEVYSVQHFLMDKNFKKADSVINDYLGELKITDLSKFLSEKGAFKNILADTETVKRLVKIATMLQTQAMTHAEEFGEKSNELYLLAAILLNQLKLNQSFNIEEIGLLKDINAGIMTTRVASLDNDDVIIKLLEGNQSLELLQKNKNNAIAIKTDEALNKLIQKREKINRKLTKITKSYLNDKLKSNSSQNEIYLNLVNARDSINGQIKKQYPKYVFYTSPDFDLKSYQSQLSADEATLRFYLTETRSYAFIISKNKTVYVNFGDRKILKEMVSAFTKGITSRTDMSSVISDLEKFLEPVFSEIKNYTELKIVPHEELSFLPFQVLLNTDFSESPITLSYCSALALDTNNENSNKITSVATFAPKYFNNLDTSNTSIIAAIERSGSYELPNAYEEASFISELFNGRLFSGKDANKQQFLKNADCYTLLHLAMHATVNNSEYGEDAILLFSGDNKTDYMSINDVYNLQLNAELTTLSACNTAYGTIDPVEGVMSLSRAFQYAGSSATLTSLWRVPDRETSIIMKKFYENLKRGQSKSMALKKAKQHYLNTVEDINLRHPYYWAGFVLTGDTSAITNGINWWVHGIGAFVVLVLLFFAIKKRLKTT